MQAERHAGLLGGAEHRVPRIGVERREPEGRGVLGERDGTGPLRRAPLDLGGGQLDVPQRQDDERDEAIRCGPAPLVDHEVVVGLDAETGELLVLRPEEHRPGELRERREAQLGGDAVDVHVGHARLRVVAPGQDLVEAGGLEAELLAGLAGDGVERDLRVQLTLEQPDVGRRGALGCTVGHDLDDPGPELAVLPPAADPPRPSGARRHDRRSR